MARKQNDLRALRSMIGEAHRTFSVPQHCQKHRSQRAYDLLTAAVHLADSLLEESPAATLGAKGGKQTAKRGSGSIFARSRPNERRMAAGAPPKTPGTNQPTLRLPIRYFHLIPLQASLRPHCIRRGYVIQNRGRNESRPFQRGTRGFAQSHGVAGAGQEVPDTLRACSYGASRAA